jgi:hypothetical protein
MAKRVQLGARLPKGLYGRLKRFAEGSGRSIGAELEIALNDYFAEQDSEPELPEELERAVEKKVDEYLIEQGYR